MTDNRVRPVADTLHDLFGHLGCCQKRPDGTTAHLHADRYWTRMAEHVVEALPRPSPEEARMAAEIAEEELVQPRGKEPTP